MQRCPCWQVAFANERKDHRYYELVEDTLHPEFDYRYFVIKDAAGQACAVQPVFLLDLDLLVGVSPRFGVVVRWAIANGYESFRSSALNYDPKLHLRHLLDPLDLYVRHTSAPINALLKHILPALEPTRYDETLAKFRNYQELWAPPRRLPRLYSS